MPWSTGLHSSSKLLPLMLQHCLSRQVAIRHCEPPRPLVDSEKLPHPGMLLGGRHEMHGRLPGRSVLKR